MAETKTTGKLTYSVVAIVVLSICLVITTAAIVYANVSVENNLFRTGNVKINLNDGKEIIKEHEFIFEPGMTVKKEFFIKNESSRNVYYRLYLDDVSGGLSDVLTVTIKHGEKILYSGTANELTKQNAIAADDTIKVGQRKDLTVCFYFPEYKGNDAQNSDLTFTMCAEAVQTDSNSNKLFN